MKAELGKYWFGRYYNRWAVYQYTYVDNDSARSELIEKADSYEEALRATWRMNGWGEPRYIKSRDY